MNRSLLIISLLVFLQLAISCTVEEDKWMPKILTEKADEVFLPDFSFAGYKWGEEPIPDFEGEVISIEDYGAIANDKKDDTKALLITIKYLT